jgi:hypothetical protein
MAQLQAVPAAITVPQSQLVTRYLALLDRAAKVQMSTITQVPMAQQVL